MERHLAFAFLLTTLEKKTIEIAPPMREHFPMWWSPKGLCAILIISDIYHGCLISLVILSSRAKENTERTSAHENIRIQEALKTEHTQKIKAAKNTDK